ncbi:MAG: hypothetical protein GX539_00705 [Candidatus Cloacimonetes bacterium]|jgi:hypothetical protein|nr:hypothetical protein [Candidatus Cloacimonadota bacterium]
MATHSNRRVRDVQLRVDVDLHPGWVSGADVELEPGDIVMCTDGRAEVVKILGRTGDSSRLLELRLETPGAKPFFAAASNVLAQPES